MLVMHSLSGTTGSSGKGRFGSDRWQSNGDNESKAAVTIMLSMTCADSSFVPSLLPHQYKYPPQTNLKVPPGLAGQGAKAPQAGVTRRHACPNPLRQERPVIARSHAEGGRRGNLVRAGTHNMRRRQDHLRFWWRGHFLAVAWMT